MMAMAVRDNELGSNAPFPSASIYPPDTHNAAGRAARTSCARWASLVLARKNGAPLSLPRRTIYQSKRPSFVRQQQRTNNSDPLPSFPKDAEGCEQSE